MAQGKTVDDKIPKDIQAMSFEAALEELQRIVGQLESGEGALDQAIDAYQRGAALKQHCESKLRQAKAQIEKISLGPGDEAKTEPFDVD
jgi:exodeoxyribonuclease VII small subunit